MFTSTTSTLANSNPHHFKTKLFPGHIVSEQGIEMDPAKTVRLPFTSRPESFAALSRASRLVPWVAVTLTITLGLAGFLGLAGWYHNFIPHVANLVVPLNHMKKEGVKWEWTTARPIWML